MNRILIGIIGKKGAGKTTAANFLCKHHSGFNRRSLAEVMKEMALVMGFTREQVYGDQKESVHPILGFSSRVFQQKVGTDFGRNMLGKDVWIKSFFARHGEEARVVCDDVRFPNEVTAFTDRGGIILKIDRPSIRGITDEHESELYYDRLPFRHLIVNDGTLEELERKVTAIFGFLEAK